MTDRVPDAADSRREPLGPRPRRLAHRGQALGPAHELGDLLDELLRRVDQDAGLAVDDRLGHPADA
jgi:hypothetical protein